MSIYSFGDIITLDFPYSHHRSGKKRPAMIVAQDGEGDMVVARITSKVKMLPTDISIRDWSASGLNVPSYLRLSKIVTIEEGDVLSHIGKLSEFDRTQAIEANIRFAVSHR
jgi:mRNA-degrading endonuclease toxin of MazEF toxin-antitoxin module